MIVLQFLFASFLQFDLTQRLFGLRRHPVSFAIRMRKIHSAYVFLQFDLTQRLFGLRRHPVSFAIRMRKIHSAYVFAKCESLKGESVIVLYNLNKFQK